MSVREGLVEEGGGHALLLLLAAAADEKNIYIGLNIIIIINSHIINKKKSE